MNLKGHIGVAAHPDLRLRARVDRLDFAMQGEAALALSTQTIRVEVGEVPLRLAIPFHRRRRVIAGSVGPFRVTLRPIEATVRITEARTAGTFGSDAGIGAELHCQGNCKAEIELAGEAPGKVLKAAFEGVFEE
jgi:hypothetical protein